MSDQLAKDIADLQEAAKYMWSVIEEMQRDNLNRDVRLGLLEGRLNGIGDDDESGADL